MSAATFSEWGTTYLEERGIDPAVAAECGVAEVSTDTKEGVQELARVLDRPAQSVAKYKAGLVFNYRTRKPFVRLMEPGDGPKFLTAAASGVGIYDPRPPQGNRPLLVVEGQTRVLAVISSGAEVDAVGLAGCEGWHARGDRRTLLPDLAAAVMKATSIVIALDGDWGTNDNVLHALVGLIDAVQALRKDADVRFLVPHVPFQPKAGLDDLLARKPPAERATEVQRMVCFALPAEVKAVIDTLAEDRLDYRNGETMLGYPEDLGTIMRLGEQLPLKEFDHLRRRLAGLLNRAPDSLPLHPSDVRRAVPEWLEARETKYSYRDMALVEYGRLVDHQHLGAAMRLDLARPAQQLEDAYTMWEARQKLVALKTVQESVAFVPNCKSSGLDQIQCWVRGVTGRCDPLDVAVVQHLVWQVKRKLAGMSVDWHMMPVVVGRQGSGKSTAIAKFVEPVADLCTNKSADVLADERQFSALAHYFIVVMDEMHRAGAHEAAALKATISNERLSWRLLGTHKHQVRPNVATMIGTSNKPIQDLIKDDTGMRRFWQIDAADQIDWDVINQISYVLIWASIDPTADSPVVAHLDGVKARQERLRTPSSVEEFVTHRCVRGEGWTPASILFDWYTKRCREAGVKPTSMAVFGRELTALGVQSKKSSVKLYRISYLGVVEQLTADEPSAPPLPTAATSPSFAAVS